MMIAVDALKKIGIEESSFPLILPGWEKSNSQMPEEIDFLQTEQLEKNRKYCGINDETGLELQRTAAIIRGNEALKQFTWHVFYKLTVQYSFEGSVSEGFKDWPEPPVLGELSPLFYLIVALGIIPSAVRLYRQINVPEQIIRDTLYLGHRQGQSFKGMDSKSLGWCRNYMAAKLFTIGRFQYRVIENLHSGAVLRNYRTGHKIMICGPDVKLNCEGIFVQIGTEKPDDVTSHFEMNDTFVKGFPVDPHGFVILAEKIFLLKDWEVILRKGDMVLDMHIPGGGGMTLDRCRDSFVRAFSFFADRMKDKIKPVVISHSWIFNTQFEELLPKSNMAEFMRQCYLYPWTSSGDDGLYFLFGSKKYPSWNDYPHDTSLRCAMLKILESGGRLRRGGMMFFAEDLPEFGNSIYRKNFQIDREQFL